MENTTRLTNEDWVDEEEDSVVMRKTNRVMKYLPLRNVTAEAAT
jgi:hypothetical protein